MGGRRSGGEGGRVGEGGVPELGGSSLGNVLGERVGGERKVCGEGETTKECVGGRGGYRCVCVWGCGCVCVCVCVRVRACVHACVYTCTCMSLCVHVIVLGGKVHEELCIAC